MFIIINNYFIYQTRNTTSPDIFHYFHFAKFQILGLKIFLKQVHSQFLCLENINSKTKSAEIKSFIFFISRFIFHKNITLVFSIIFLVITKNLRML